MNSMKGDGSIPRELAAVVSTKYRFVVQVTSKSFESESSKPSYQVHRVDINFGQQPHSSALRHKPALGLASSSKSPTSQSLLMLGSSAGGHSPSSGVSTVDATSTLADPDDTNSAYILSSETTPLSVSKLPNLRSKNVSATSAARKVLFPADGHENQTGQGLLIHSDAAPTLPIDGAAAKDPLTSIDPSVLDTGSQIIKKLETLPVDKTTVEELPVNKCVEEESSSHADVTVPAATVPSGASSDNKFL